MCGFSVTGFQFRQVLGKFILRLAHSVSSLLDNPVSGTLINGFNSTDLHDYLFHLAAGSVNYFSCSFLCLGAKLRLFTFKFSPLRFQLLGKPVMLCTRLFRKFHFFLGAAFLHFCI